MKHSVFGFAAVCSGLPEITYPIHATVIVRVAKLATALAKLSVAPNCAPPGITYQDMGGTPMSWMFVADDTSTTLAFESLTPAEKTSDNGQ